MTQVLFSAATTPQLTDLDANFTELYGRTATLLTTSGNVRFTQTTSFVDSILSVKQGGTTTGNKSILSFEDSGGTNSQIWGYGTAFGAGLSSAIGIAPGGVLKAVFDTSGNFMVNQTTPGAFNVNGLSMVGGAMVVNHVSGTASGTGYVAFCYNATQIGSIAQSGTTAVLYNTTSDYRIKNNPQTLTGSGAFIDALRPRTWTWITDGSPGAGFIAHEFATVSPNSVSGSKDAVDADGQPILQTMDAATPEVVANIVAELQDLRRRVASLGG